jgi:hypothetical protein
MLYCHPCAEIKGYPILAKQSRGICEVCGKQAKIYAIKNKTLEEHLGRKIHAEEQQAMINLDRRTRGYYDANNQIIIREPTSARPAKQVEIFDQDALSFPTCSKIKDLIPNLQRVIELYPDATIGADCEGDIHIYLGTRPESPLEYSHRIMLEDEANERVRKAKELDDLNHNARIQQQIAALQRQIR